MAGRPQRRAGEGWHRVPDGYEGTFQGRHWIIIYQGKPRAGNIGGWDVVVQVHRGEYSAGTYPSEKLWIGWQYAKQGQRYMVRDHDASLTKDDITREARDKIAEQYRRRQG